MKSRTAVSVLTVCLLITGAWAQIPVFDATNFGNAVERFIELQKQYAQLVATYKQLVREYEHMLWMAKRLPDLARHRFEGTPWKVSESANTYGTTGGWTKAINTGVEVLEGYLEAIERLATYGDALAGIPPEQLERAKSHYGTVELADAANLHGMELLGTQRGKARSTESAIEALEEASLSTRDEMNTEIAVLNKINAAAVMGLRAGQDTNQLLVSLLEQTITDSKARRDAEAVTINANIVYRQNALDAGMKGIRDTTEAITNFRMP